MQFYPNIAKIRFWWDNYSRFWTLFQ